ncbi:MAG: hypothetical protein HYV07_20330 [Deltaproteobacteria bacterium]|nr:hypothetical protein [Deltaproteobacteria bacterium]
MRSAALFLAALVFGGCERAEPEADPTCGGKAPLAARGPFPVGVRTIDVDGLAIEVWYPAIEGARDVGSFYDLRDWLHAEGQAKVEAGVLKMPVEAARDAPPADGPFFAVVFSHGLAAYRSQSTFLTTHLASHGFVVLAPDHLSRGLARLLAGAMPSFEDAPQELMKAIAFARGPRDARLPNIDSSRIATAGHSAGAGSSAAVALDPAARVWVNLAGTSSDPAPAVPALFMTGSHDGVVPSSQTRAAFEAHTSTASYFELNAAGHLVFSDICEIAKERGGLVAVARETQVTINPLFLALGGDGCTTRDLPPSVGWPPILHFVTAAIVRALRPAESVADDDTAASCFGAAILSRQ